MIGKIIRIHNLSFSSNCNPYLAFGYGAGISFLIIVMKQSGIRVLLVVLVASLLLQGCSFGTRTVRRKMGDSAPVFTRGGSLEQFVVGAWSLEKSDADFSELLAKLGTEASTQGYGKVADSSDEKPATYISSLFEFNQDGSFKITKVSSKTESGYETLGGTWKVQGQVVNIIYTTINDKPLTQYQNEIKEASERGTQAGVLGDIMLDWQKAYLEKRTTLRVTKEGRRLAFYTLPTNSEQAAEFVSMDFDLEELERLKVEQVKN